MNAEAVSQNFASAVASLAEHRPATLRSLWLAAADADDAFHAVCGPNARPVTDFEFSRLQEAQYEAEKALRDFLLNEHGLTTADLRRSVL